MTNTDMCTTYYMAKGAGVYGASSYLPKIEDMRAGSKIDTDFF